MFKTINLIPKLPLSALIFYLSIVVLWRCNLIPNPYGIIAILEELYKSYGLLGLFIASFLEGIVYLGLYFPGSLIVSLAVILSDGSFKSLITISLVVASALTITAIINYIFGKKIVNRTLDRNLICKEKEILSKGLIVSMLHPNTLAFYFFNAGIKNHNFLKILFVPLIMIPYGLALGYLIYLVKEPFKKAFETPYIMISYILIWFLISFFMEIKKSSRN